MKRTYHLTGQLSRAAAAQAVMNAPDNYVCEVKEATRNNDQNAKLHATLTEIADQVEWCGKTLDVDVWKRLCTAAWLREEGQHPMMIPALDGNGFDVVFERTSKLSRSQCASLTEWILAFGTEQGVKWRAYEYEDIAA